MLKLAVAPIFNLIWAGGQGEMIKKARAIICMIFMMI